MSGLGPMGREILAADDRSISRSVARAILPELSPVTTALDALDRHHSIVEDLARAAVEYEALRHADRLGREILAARARAHAKHGDNSIEGLPADSPEWLAILVEEVGEVAHALTYDSAPDAETRRRNLEGELVDVLAVASAWLDASRAARGDGS